MPGSGRGARTGGSPDRLPAPSPGTACPPLEEPQVWLGLRIPKLSQGIPSLLLFRLASDTAVPGPWGWAEATGARGDPELEGWRVGLAWCGDLPGVRLRPQAWSPREEFQALGSPLPGPGVPGLRGRSRLLGPGPDGAGPGLRARPPPPRQLLARDLRGEMTLPATDELRPSLRGSTPGRGVTQLLSLSQVLSSVGEGVWAVGP